jgi:hypothetical protein
VPSGKRKRQSSFLDSIVMLTSGLSFPWPGIRYAEVRFCRMTCIHTA